MSKKNFDAIVIGAGVNGSSAALHLAKYGKNTVLIEQFPLPHSRGSSAGQSRIIRYANTSPESFMPILIDSFKQWKNLEQETQMSLLRHCPLFSIAKTKNEEELKLMYRSAERANQHPKWRTGRDFNKEYGTSFNDDYAVVEEANAGVLMASKCLLALQKRFVELRGTILDEFPICNVSVNKNGRVSVEGPKGIVEGNYMIICAGPWAPTLLPKLGINHLQLTPLRVAVYYWRVKDPKAYKPFDFIVMGEGIPNMYGLPSAEYPGMIKLGKHIGFECDPDTRDCVDESKCEEVTKLLCDFVRSNFPWLDSQPAIKETCIYTASEDEEMIIDQHPKYKNIAYACGFSGTGFKTGPTVGQILTELALGKTCFFDISDFRSDRFKNAKGAHSLSKL